MPTPTPSTAELRTDMDSLSTQHQDKGGNPSSGSMQGEGQTIPTPDEPLTDSQRQSAIARAFQSELEHLAERDLYEALWDRDGCFSHKGAADRALAMAQEARRLRGLLEQGSGQEAGSA